MRSDAYEPNPTFREALEAVEQECGLELVVLYRDQAVEPESGCVYLNTWTTPPELSDSAAFATNYFATNVLTVTQSDPFVTMYQIEDASEDDVMVGTVRPFIVYDYLGLHRIPEEHFTESFIEKVIREPILRAIDPEFVADMERTRRQAQRARLVEFAQTTHNNSINQRRDAIDQRQRALVEYQNGLTSTIRAIREDQQLLDALLHMQEHDAGEQVVREWDRLSEHPRVASLDYSDNRLVVTTTDDLRLHRSDTDESRWLGSFRLVFSLQNLSITVKNLDTRRGGRDHPHVVDGNPCFGAHGPAFAELFARGELYTLFELLIQYLETLNLQDEYGRYGAYWFDVPDERPLVEANNEMVEA